MQISYSDIAECYGRRRKGLSYRSLRGYLSPSLAVTEGSGAGDLVIGYAYEMALKDQWDPATGCLARIWPNGDFDFTPLHTIKHKYLATGENNTLQKLTGDLWILERNTSIKQLGWRYFQHPSQYAGTREAWNDLSYPSGHRAVADAEAYWHTRRTLLAQTRKDTAVIAPGAVHYDTASGALKSLEPVLTRSWQPEERKAYRARMRELKDQVEFRGRLGALGDHPDEESISASFIRDHGKTDGELLVAANIEDNDSLRAIADRAMWRTFTRGPVTHDVIAQQTKRFVINKAEALRQHLRAVVYS